MHLSCLLGKSVWRKTWYSTHARIKAGGAREPVCGRGCMRTAHPPRQVPWVGQPGRKLDLASVFGAALPEGPGIVVWQQDSAPGLPALGWQVSSNNLQASPAMEMGLPCALLQ